MKLPALGVFCLFASLGIAQVTVKVSAPLAGSSVNSPIKVQATASSSHPITGWQVYLDGADAYTGGATTTISTSLAAANGAHTLVVRAWDSTGVYGTQTLTTTVTTAVAPASTSTSTSGPTIQVSAPLTGSSVGSPFSVQATASGSNPITGWQVYLDGADVYTGGATTTISANVSAANGTHTLVIRAWDTSGAYGTQTLTTTVASSTQPATVPPPASVLPTPPSTAKVFSNIEQMTTGWSSCNSPSCAGGTGAGSYWQAFNQTSPSLSGRSMELFNDGAWANALFYNHLGANDSVTNFLWDFYVQVDSPSLTATQALEYDAFQFVAGYNYMIGTQCDYGNGYWDTWDEASGHWLATTIPCKKFTTGAWHHIQWYMTTNHTNHTYTYQTLVVDGVPYTLNQTQPAKYLGWGDNLGVQWQLDVNASGTGYHEWVDNANLTIW